MKDTNSIVSTGKVSSQEGQESTDWRGNWRKRNGRKQLNRRVSNEQLSSKTYKELTHFKCSTANDNPHKSEQMTWINHSSDGQEFMCKITWLSVRCCGSNLRLSCLNISFVAGNAFWVTKDILGDCRHAECKSFQITESYPKIPEKSLEGYHMYSKVRFPSDRTWSACM